MRPSAVVAVVTQPFHVRARVWKVSYDYCNPCTLAAACRKNGPVSGEMLPYRPETGPRPPLSGPPHMKSLGGPHDTHHR